VSIEFNLSSLRAIQITACILLSGCVTTQSVGTDMFMKNGRVCGLNVNTYTKCMETHPEANSYTPAEHQLIAYVDVIVEKVDQERAGQVLPADD
jgi:hypothetical protein